MMKLQMKNIDLKKNKEPRGRKEKLIKLFTNQVISLKLKMMKETKNINLQIHIGTRESLVTLKTLSIYIEFNSLI